MAGTSAAVEDSAVDDSPQRSAAPPKFASISNIKAHGTVQENKFKCPAAWYLAVYSAGMTATKIFIVSGALFFVMAEAETVTPMCWQWRNPFVYFVCTAQVVCFWTYPVVCCIFSLILYLKNMVDMRIYYEFLLHRVIIGFERYQVWTYPTVNALLIYAAIALSSICWHIGSQEPTIHLAVNYVFVYLAYLTPVFSFLIVLLTQWSIQGQLVTLADFLEDFDWGVHHLRRSRCFKVKELQKAYYHLEDQLVTTGVKVTTPQLVALVAHYAAENAQIEEHAGCTADADDEEHGNPNASSPNLGASSQVSDKASLEEETEKEACEHASYLNRMFTAMHGATAEARLAAVRASRWIYWPLRLLFNDQLQDERAWDFRRWTAGYVLATVILLLLGIYLYACCIVIALKLEKLIPPNTKWTEYFCISRDFGQVSPSHFSAEATTAMARNLGRAALRRVSMVHLGFGH